MTRGIFEAGSVVAGRYELVRQIGEGGMGVVMAARDMQRGGRDVAIKFLHPHLLGDDRTVERFKNEVLLARRLSSPHIVSLTDIGKDAAGGFFVTMELIRGVPLRALVRDGQPLEASECSRILLHVARALAHAHEKGILHRDLKPENILVDEEGTAKLSDFGIARLLDEQHGLTRTGEILGTPHYLAPEAIAGGVADPRLDVYAFGVLAYELATGHRPFEETSYFAVLHAHLTKDMPDPAKLAPGCAAWLRDLIERCTEKAPERRPENGGALVQSIERDAAASARRRRFIPADRVLSVRTRKKLRHYLSGTPFVSGILVALVLLAPTIEKVNVSIVRDHSVLWLESLAGGELPWLRAISGFDYPTGPNALFELMTQGQPYRFGMLLRYGADPDTAAPGGMPLVSFAVEVPAFEFARQLIRAGAKDIDVADSNGVTPLMRAIEWSAYLDLIYLLVENGARLDAVDHRGLGPLHKAAAQPAPDSQHVIAYLAASGATIDLPCERGLTPLIHAAVIGPYRNVELLLALGADPDRQDHDGLTALHHAAAANRPDVIKLLVAHGASLDVQSEIFQTPLAVAVVHSSSSAVTALLDLGAQLDVRDALGLTALGTAIRGGYPAGVAALVRAGAATACVAGPPCITAFELAMNVHEETVPVLIRAGAPLDLRDSKGRTPLMVAVSLRKASVVKMLLEAGADPRAVDERGQSVRQYAIASGDSVIKKLVHAAIDG